MYARHHYRKHPYHTPAITMEPENAVGGSHKKSYKDWKKRIVTKIQKIAERTAPPLGVAQVSATLILFGKSTSTNEAVTLYLGSDLLGESLAKYSDLVNTVDVAVKDFLDAEISLDNGQDLTVPDVQQVSMKEYTGFVRTVNLKGLVSKYYK